MPTILKSLKDIQQEELNVPPQWQFTAVINDDNMAYVIGNENSRELLIIDPMKDDWDALKKIHADFADYTKIAVIDTHTHADHISCAADLANLLQAPLIMHQSSPSQRVHLRVCHDLRLNLQGGPLHILTTPGHTPDSLALFWGPFLFTGDTILHGDTGRDDLPGGNPTLHFESLLKIKKYAKPSHVFLPGHDCAGGRATTWSTQLKINSSLNQDREAFIQDATLYVGPSPKNLKESLFENFK